MDLFIVQPQLWNFGDVDTQPQFCQAKQFDIQKASKLFMLDGRDTPPEIRLEGIQQLQPRMLETQTDLIASKHESTTMNEICNDQDNMGGYFLWDYAGPVRYDWGNKKQYNCIVH